MEAPGSTTSEMVAQVATTGKSMGTRIRKALYNVINNAADSQDATIFVLYHRPNGSNTHAIMLGPTQLTQNFLPEYVTCYDDNPTYRHGPVSACCN